MINRSGMFINMPVVRIDTGRNNDNQSEKEKEKERQLERQMPRMRTGEKNRSEKILENALQSGLKKNSSQEFSNLPRPATIKHNKNEDDLHQDLKRKDISNREPDSKNTLKHEPANKDDLKHEPKIKDDVNHEKELTAPDLAGLHTLEELLHRRENPPSLSDILNMLKTTDKKMKHDQVPEAKTKQDNAELSDTLCSLDFLGGYVSASAEMPVIRGEIMEVIESLRQQVTNRSSEVGVNIPLSQEGLVQLIGDSETQLSLNQDSAGHQTLVIEVTESTMSKIVSSPRRSETKDPNFNQNRKPGDDTLPLTVQRGV
jgi:hypothetical protein